MSDGMEVIADTGLAQRTENSRAVFALSFDRPTANLRSVNER
jgi:hypothetical protein